MEQTDVPQTNGLVQLKTLHGSIDIHLFTNESPLNTKKFISLCLEGHYDYLPFGRYEKDFILQTTSEQTQNLSKTKTATTKLETSPLLKFNRRALVAMVSVDEHGSSSDNFFITLAPAPELNRKSTIIGEVMGDSVHTLSKLEDSYDPVYSLIIGTKVINHPWDDITSSIPDRDPIIIKRISALKPKIDEYLGIELLSSSSLSSSLLSYNANGHSKEKKANEEEEEKVKLKEADHNKRKRSLLSFKASSSSSSDDDLNDDEVVVKKADLPKAVRMRVSAMGGDVDEIPYQSDDEDEAPKQQKEQKEQKEEVSQMDLEILALQKAILAEPGKFEGTTEIPAAKERISSLSKLLGHRVKREDPQMKDKNKKQPIDKDAILASFKEKLSNSSSSTDLHGNGDGGDDTNTDGRPTCPLHSLRDCQSCCLEKPVKPAAAAEEKPWLTHRLLFKR